MEQRLNYMQAAPEIYQAMIGLSAPVQKSGLDEKLVNLAIYRASQINKCAFCLDMHSKDLIAMGESPQRLYMMEAWREWNGFTEKERAALEWAEAITLLTHDYVPDEVFERVRRQFSESELAYLTLALVAINGWNRLNVAFRTPGGNYQPQRREAVAAV